MSTKKATKVRRVGTSIKIKAWAWRSGLIEFGKSVPSGAFPILSADGVCFSRQQIEVAARHGKTLLVPGVPEAPSDAKAYEAFESWVRWLRKPEVTA